MRLRPVVIALATMRVTDITKEVLPVIPPPWAKSLFAAVMAGGLTALESRQWKRAVVDSLASAGAASLLHDVQTALMMFSDSHRQAILMRARPRP
jgi:hypothetical protein